MVTKEIKCSEIQCAFNTYKAVNQNDTYIPVAIFFGTIDKK